MPSYPAAVSRFPLMAATAFLRIVDSPHKVSFEPRQGRIENGPCGRHRGCGAQRGENVGDLPPGPPLDAHFLRGQRMTDAEGRCGCTVRIVVKLRPDQYDELVRHARERGSTMSAFLRESAARVMKEGLLTQPALPANRMSERRAGLL
jgi:hypothetical protein